jgi:hypothetical protein
MMFTTDLINLYGRVSVLSVINLLFGDSIKDGQNVAPGVTFVQQGKHQFDRHRKVLMKNREFMLVGGECVSP